MSLYMEHMHRVALLTCSSALPHPFHANTCKYWDPHLPHLERGFTTFMHVLYPLILVRPPATFLSSMHISCALAPRRNGIK